MERIYLDHNATSPLRPVAREAILEAVSEGLANPNSIHSTGRKTRRRVDDAREAVAELIGAKPNELIFTSGGTEANHLAWKSFQRSGASIVVSSLEHPCVLAASEQARRAGARVRSMEFDANGSWINESTLAADANDLVSLHMANNETGWVPPYEEMIESLAQEKSSVHLDGVQYIGKDHFSVKDLRVDFLSLSAHKLGALGGVGALYKKRGAPLESIWEGGPQERGRRPGTENVLGIVALGAVCRELIGGFEAEVKRIRSLRDRLETELITAIGDCIVVNQNQRRLPNTSNIIFSSADAEALLIAADLEGIDVSTGAACSSGSLEPSHVLLAMGFDVQSAKSALRFSLGWSTTEDDIRKVLAIFPKLVDKARGLK